MKDGSNSAIRELIAVLRERTWLSPVSANEMTDRDRWLADKMEAALTADPEQAAPPPFLLKADDLRAWFRPSDCTIHIGEHSISTEHARRIAVDILGLIPADSLSPARAGQDGTDPPSSGSAPETKGSK